MQIPDMTSIPRTVVLIASLLWMCASPALAVLSLFADLLDGIGPTRVQRDGDRLSIDFSR